MKKRLSQYPLPLYSGISTALIVVYLLLPNSLGLFFGGLPWSTPIEFLVIGIIIPILLLLNHKWIGRFYFSICFLALLVTKIALMMMVPSSGWEMRIFTSQENMATERWQRTYTTLLSPGISSRLESSWATQREFPIEWANDYETDHSKLWLGVQWEGYLRLPESSQLIIMADGTSCGSVKYKNNEGIIGNIPIVESKEDMDSILFQPIGNFASIEGQICFSKEDNWSFVPLIRSQDGTLSDATENNFLWSQSSIEKISDSALRVLSIVAQTIDWVLILFLILWIIDTYRHSHLATLLYVILLGVVCFGLQQTLMPQIIEYDGTGISYIGFWVIIIGLINLIIIRRYRTQIVDRLGLDYWLLLTIVPIIFVFFLSRWWHEIGRMQFIPPLDDWHEYQVFARQIFVFGDWLHQSKPVLTYQPLYRYLVGIMHTLFGQSHTSLYLINIWAIIGSTVIIIRLAKYFQINWWVTWCTSCGYLFFIFFSAFRHHIDRGMQEFPALLLLMLTVFMFLEIQVQNKNKLSVLLLMVFALLAIWIRLDHVLIVAAAGIFLWKPMRGNIKEAYLNLIKSSWKNRQTLLVYWGILIAGLLLVAMRNYLLGGEFVLTRSQIMHSDWAPNNLSGYINGITIVLNGGPSYGQTYNFSHIVGTIPIVVILWAGTIVAGISLLFRVGWIKRYPTNIGIMLSAGLIPYAFFLPVAYPPRWSIHIFPWTILALAITIDIITRKIKIRGNTSRSVNHKENLMPK